MTRERTLRSSAFSTGPIDRRKALEREDTEPRLLDQDPRYQ